MDVCIVTGKTRKTILVENEQNIIMMETQIQLEELFNDLVENGSEIKIHNGDYEVIDCDGIDILTAGNKYVKLLKVSRHKTSKHLLQIVIESENRAAKLGHHLGLSGNNVNSVSVTTDHICMVYNKDHFFENLNANQLKVGQTASVYDEVDDKEYVGVITYIEDLGQTDEYVYDCEVDDDMHSFYANDILVHNSQFIDLQCVTEDFRKRYGLKGYFGTWPRKYIREVWNEVSKFVDDDVNKFVRDLVHNYCKTDEQDVLTYELEYMSSQGIYEGKKHYFTHKVIEEGDDVDKDKVTGIQLKQNIVSKEMKRYLSEIYQGVVNKCWTEKQFNDYISDLYNEFTKFSVDEVAFWRGYSTAREADGFLQMAVGATGISKSVTFFNQIIESMKLGRKYDQIQLGAKVREVYLDKANKYGIDRIAYLPDQWPKEFNDIFKVDYHTMFNKIILDPLKKFRAAAKFEDIDPSKQVITDVFDL